MAADFLPSAIQEMVLSHQRAKLLASAAEGK
jgi:hypothetical protein